MHKYGCPMHLGVGETGLIDSIAYLENRHSNLSFPIVEEVVKEEENLPNLKNLNGVVATCNTIASYAYDVLSKGEFPLFIGGDHSSAMGTVSASSAYNWDTNQQDTGLIWIDAHPDINLETTSVTGNIHGMPVASLLGYTTDKLSCIFNERTKLKAENVVYFGLRDIDPPEQIILDEHNIRYYTYSTICERGFDVCLKEAIEYMSHLSAVHVSFDIDSVNPGILPGVSVPVPDGLTIPEAMETFKQIFTNLPVMACDIVEFNHVYDRDDVTADFVSELVDLVQKLHK